MGIRSLTLGLTQGKCRYAHELCSAPGVYLTRKRAGSHRQRRRTAPVQIMCLVQEAYGLPSSRPSSRAEPAAMHRRHTPADAKAPRCVAVCPSEALQHDKELDMPHKNRSLQYKKERSGDKHTPKVIPCVIAD